MTSQFSLDAYDYKVPEEAIAAFPVEPADAARLLIYDTKTDSVTFSTFAQISEYLPANAKIIRNVTTVVHAKVHIVCKGESHEAIVLANEPFSDDGCIGMMARGSFAPGDTAILGGVSLEFVRRNGTEWQVRIDGVDTKEKLLALLAAAGETPLPPYIAKRTKLSDEEASTAYQTVFAKEGASVAAPTASLHFTERVIESITQKGISFHDVLLNVGRGTFTPVSSEMIERGALHREEYSISNETLEAIEKAKGEDVPVIALGTTVTRALESYAKTGASAGWTDMFIRPSYEFKIVDALITNFHVPKSSLMALVDAFLQHKKAKRNIRQLYDIALAQGFRFFSFGDGMLIL
jgi:S-adenosylmethionine:tRNA ribosyltransferase-isomerase